ncbi:MAG: amidophosphoribosyltransferase [Clostridiales bacterium]|jgi:amidophosphoribosyltransferase|nr:amidophosphoribosyltransferase [Clostridiales bacterium]
MVFKKHCLDKLHEECGVFGIAAAPDEGIDPAAETYIALFALQHRGQESCGIAVSSNDKIMFHKDTGLVPDVFNEKILSELKGEIAIGHVRYSTTGSMKRVNSQPIVMSHIYGDIAVAHNGNLVNSKELRYEFEKNGCIFHTTNDSEIIAYMIVRERLSTDSIEQAIKNAMKHLSGAYSLVIISGKKLIAVRDPNGFRPLCMGRTGKTVVFASESCAFDAIGAEFIRDIEPGEIVTVEDGRITSLDSGIRAREALCVFEFVYFARPDSIIDGVSVELARQAAGRCLARRNKVEADIVIGVPDSGISAAMGFAKESGIPYGVGLIKNRYIGRTFIQPSQGQRQRAVKIKLNALASAVRGKRVIMVDDSIVRGTTCARIVNLLREAGAVEVHMRVSSPPFMHPCYFGTDVPDRIMLMAHNRSFEEIREILGVDSLDYLTLEDLPETVEGLKCGFCNACFTGDYAVKVSDGLNKDILGGCADE